MFLGSIAFIGALMLVNIGLAYRYDMTPPARLLAAAPATTAPPLRNLRRLTEASVTGNTPSLFGVGIIDMISDQDILALESAQKKTETVKPVQEPEPVDFVQKTETVEPVQEVDSPSNIQNNESTAIIQETQFVTKIEEIDTVESPEVVSNSVTTVQEVLGDMMGDAPACYDCGHITIRNGSCYKCLNCGNSLGCS